VNAFIYFHFYCLNAGGSLSADKKIAFFVGLTENFGPVTEHTDIVFDRVITNIGSAYNAETGRFTAPTHGVFQFNVVISAQGRQKVSQLQAFSPSSVTYQRLCCTTRKNCCSNYDG
jgi:C1q domain